MECVCVRKKYKERDKWTLGKSRGEGEWSWCLGERGERSLSGKTKPLNGAEGFQEPWMERATSQQQQSRANDGDRETEEEDVCFF